jgi:DNA-binding NarL/FixJ family response regulator
MVSPTQSNAVELVCSADKAQSMNLTAREVEILRWVECGMANADIAVLCEVSVRTIHKHLQHIFDKLNVENRMAAVRRVRDHVLESRTKSDSV